MARRSAPESEPKRLGGHEKKVQCVFSQKLMFKTRPMKGGKCINFFSNCSNSVDILRFVITSLSYFIHESSLEDCRVVGGWVGASGREGRRKDSKI